MVGALLRRPWRLIRLVAALPALLGLPLGLADRGRLKGAVLRGALGGLSRVTLGAWRDRFIADTLARRLFADARTAIAAHKAAGDHLVLMSASPDLYVPQLGRALGFDEVLCTAIRWNGDRLDGRLAGPNCRDLEKLRRLQELRRRHPGAPVTAYGNSSADLPHLMRCEHGVYVNAGRKHVPALQGQGLTCVHWR